MNILITPDIKEWAIGALTDSIVKHNPRFNFFNIAVHPRAALQGVAEIQALMRKHKIDLWHAQYWNSAIQIMQMVPELKNIPCLLSHHNHHSLNEQDWKDFTALTIPTQHGYYILSKMHGRVVKIPYGIDLDRFSWISDHEPEEPAVGYIGRVMPHKHLKEIVITAGQLGYKVIGSGYIDKPNYWDEVPRDNLDFKGGLGRNEIPPANVKDELYRKMTVFIMYSTDEKETGTLPFLEAMARGVPVLATKQGMARDIIKDGENGIFFDEKNFKEKLKTLMQDQDLRNKIRRNAQSTMRRYNEQWMARDYARLYYNLIHPNQKMISVIVPTFNRGDKLIQVLASIERQNYQAKEIIVCDDGSTDNTAIVVQEAKKQFKTPILYLRTGEKLEYGLAKSRNQGAIEAIGDVLLFMDDRYEFNDENVLEKVSQSINSERKIWHWGKKIIKGKVSNKKAFMENFAWIRKDDFIQSGMMCERINLYGGLSEEVRARYNRLGFRFVCAAGVFAREIQSSSNRTQKLQNVWKAKLILSKMYD